MFGSSGGRRPSAKIEIQPFSDANGGLSFTLIYIIKSFFFKIGKTKSVPYQKFRESSVLLNLNLNQSKNTTS